VDEVKTLDEVVAAMSSAAVVHSADRGSAQLKGEEMSKESQAAAAVPEVEAAAEVPVVEQSAPAAVSAPAPVVESAASLDELRAACPDASSDFLVGQLDAKATASQALQAYNAELRQQLQAAQESQEVERVAGGPAASGSQFQATATSGGTAGGDPVAVFEKLVAEEAQACGDRMAAFQSCVSEHPETYAKYREAVASLSPGGAARRRRRQVGRELVRTGAAE